MLRLPTALFDRPHLHILGCGLKSDCNNDQKMCLRGFSQVSNYHTHSMTIITVDYQI